MTKQEAVAVANRVPSAPTRRASAERFGFFATPAYLRDHGTPRRLGDLARHDHVGFLDRGATSLPTYMRWLRGMVPPERFVTTASSLLAMHELARAGRGIVLGTTGLLAVDPELERLLPRARPPSMEIWLAVLAELRRDPDVMHVHDALVALFEREAAVRA